jgi:hypothetical protein
MNKGKPGGSKFDEDKPRLDLVPVAHIFAVARGFTYGCKKYEDNNWRKGIPANKLIGSIQRHLEKFRAGEDIDAESGLCHLDLIGANLSMLDEQRLTRPDLDNRWDTGVRWDKDNVMYVDEKIEPGYKNRKE